MNLNVSHVKHSRYPRLVSKLYFSPLMLAHPTFLAIEKAFLNHLSSPHARQSDGDERHLDRVNRVYEVQNGLGIIQINGIIDKHISMMEMECFGGVDLNDIDAAIEQARSDSNIKHVLLYINSPGGASTGVPETAKRVARLAETKPVTVFGDAQICSAAYYIASQAHEIIITESTDIGSIGTYMALLDMTRHMEMEGVAMNLIKAGKFKAGGAPWKKLEDEEREIFASQVKKINDAFRNAVSKGRPGINPDAMEGQTFIGSDAIPVGLADSLALGLDEVLSVITPA